MVGAELQATVNSSEIEISQLSILKDIISKNAVLNSNRFVTVVLGTTLNPQSCRSGQRAANGTRRGIVA